MAVGGNEDGQCNVNSWRDIVAISAGTSHTVGLKSNGTVTATGSNASGQCNVENWKGIVAVSAGYAYTVGLKSDGKVVVVGANSKGQCNVEDWIGTDDVELNVKNCEKNKTLRDSEFEMIIFAKRSDLCRTTTLFYFIRNAFAHGSFSVFNNNGRPVYYLENRYKGKVKGRFRLKESTLLKWIDLFYSSPEELKETNKKKTNRPKQKKKQPQYQ